MYKIFLFSILYQDDLQFATNKPNADLIGFEEFPDELEKLHRIRHGKFFLMIQNNCDYFFHFIALNTIQILKQI